MSRGLLFFRTQCSWPRRQRIPFNHLRRWHRPIRNDCRSAVA